MAEQDNQQQFITTVETITAAMATTMLLPVRAFLESRGVIQ